MNHTPGPWATDGDQIFTADQSKMRIYVAAIKRHASEWKANAHLIALAPELLSALTLALYALNDVPERGGEDLRDWHEHWSMIAETLGSVIKRLD